jgi:glycine cleavage system H protein
MSIPPKYSEYDENKFWFKRKLTSLTLGITSQAADEIGEVQSVEFPEEGADLAKGEVVVTVEGTHGTLEVTTPAAGIVEIVNEALKEEPQLVSEDPGEEGWLVKLEIEDKSELKEYIGD